MISKNKPLFESQKWNVLFEDQCSRWHGFFGLVCSKYGNCTMSNFYYNYQNPSAFCFLVQIRPVVFFSFSGSDKFEYESKNKWILVVVVKSRHRENDLLMSVRPWKWVSSIVISCACDEITDHCNAISRLFQVCLEKPHDYVFLRMTELDDTP